MNKLRITLMLFATLLSGLALAVPVRTSINVEADIDTGVRIFVNGNDVTNKEITVKLKNNNGYMGATSPPFQFIGNAKSVDLTLQTPANNQLISENGDTMKMLVYWVMPETGQPVDAFYRASNQKVFATLADVPNPQYGMRVLFRSSDRSENYDIGKYSGVYVLVVTPSI